MPLWHHEDSPENPSLEEEEEVREETLPSAEVLFESKKNMCKFMQSLGPYRKS